MENNSFKKEIKESWHEFNKIIIKYTPSFFKRLYRNKPLFILFVIVVLCLEATLGYLIYNRYFLPA